MPQKEPATPFKIQIDRLTLANKRLAAKVAAQEEELKFAKDALLKIRTGYEARVANALKMDIQSVLECSDRELLKLTEGTSIEDLESMLQNFSIAVDSKKSPYEKPSKATASIRKASGAMVPGGERLTVGNLFGKTQKEILEMGGEY